MLLSHPMIWDIAVSATCLETTDSHNHRCRCRAVIYSSNIRFYDVDLISLHTIHYRTGLVCRVSNTLGKGPFALGKGFAECGTRQTALGKKSDGEGTFAECLFSGTRQSLCRVSKSTRQTFRNQIRKTAFKNSKTFYFHPVITPIIQCHKSQVSLLFRVKSRATRLPWFEPVTSCFACSLLYHSNPVLHMSRFCFDSPHIILIRDKIACLRP